MRREPGDQSDRRLAVAQANFAQLRLQPRALRVQVARDVFAALDLTEQPGVVGEQSDERIRNVRVVERHELHADYGHVSRTVETTIVTNSA